MEFAEPQDRNRIRSFAESILLNYREDEFRLFFRMSRTSAFKLIQEVERLVDEQDVKFLTPRFMEGGRQAVPLRVKILMMLWYMASSCTYRELATLFGVNESTASHCVRAVIDLTVEHLQDRFICWPSDQECLEISNFYQTLNGLPNVVGFIDGTHIPIEKPTDRGNDYYNRKDFFSIQLQGVVREDLRFIDVYTGWPGKVHDARVFAASPIAEKGSRLCGNRHILGDPAYPCLYWLLTPFKQPRGDGLSEAETRFNRVLSSMRVQVERAFGLLKGRFKRLRPLVQSSVEQSCKTIVAACILHNICIIAADDLTFEEENGPEVNVRQVQVVNDLFANNERERGSLKRLQIARSLQQ